MKKLVIVRHGHDDDEGLNNRGREVVASLAEKLKSELGGSNIIILSSIANRACQSAEIIANKFGIESFKKSTFLESKGGFLNAKQTQKALDLISSIKNKTEVVMLVTHLEFVEYFPAFFAQRELDCVWDWEEIGKGHAWLIDCETKTIKHIKP